MTLRAALVLGALIEALIVIALALYVIGVIPAAVFGGVPIKSLFVVLNLPSSIVSLPLFVTMTALGLNPILSFMVVAAIVSACQSALIGAALAYLGFSQLKVATACLVLLAVAFITFQDGAPPYPNGMDSNGDGVVSMEEWTGFHSLHPKFYRGYDGSGYIGKDNPYYYEQEFMRVDCNRDMKMDAYEYGELNWNMRWCGSDLRPSRPWWK